MDDAMMVGLAKRWQEIWQQLGQFVRPIGRLPIEARLEVDELARELAVVRRSMVAGLIDRRGRPVTVECRYGTRVLRLNLDGDGVCWLTLKQAASTYFFDRADAVRFGEVAR